MRRLSVATIAAVLAAVFVAFAQAQRGTQSELTATSGQRAGHVRLSPTAQNKDGFTFAWLLQVNVREMLPNSTFTVQRAPDFNPDGVCTGTTWLINGPITTSEGGAGAAHFSGQGALLEGFRFDVVFRVIGNGTELRSDCMTVTVK